MGKKISLSQLSEVDLDFSNNSSVTTKDKMISNWLISFVTNGFKNKTINHGDMLPKKQEIAQMLGVSVGTVQSAIRNAEDLGYFESKQCVGTMVRDYNSNPIKFEKMSSKKDITTREIKKIIAKTKLNNPLPSSKALASKLGVSNNTVRLSLDNLVREGYVVQRCIRGREINYIVINNQIVDAEDENSIKTLSVKLSEKIKAYIVSNYKVNDKIISNEAFAKMYNVSIRTVNDAMKILKDQGLILSRRGQYGTIYLSNPNLPKREKSDKSLFMTSPMKTQNTSPMYNWEKALTSLKKYIIKNHEAGDKLPSMVELAKILNTSSNTIRKVVEILSDDDVLYTQRGKYGGVYLNNMPTDETQSYTWLALNPKYLNK